MIVISPFNIRPARLPAFGENGVAVTYYIHNGGKW